MGNNLILFHFVLYLVKSLCISLFCLLCGQNDDFNSLYTCSFAHTLCKFPLILLHLFYTKRDNSFVKMYYSLFFRNYFIAVLFLNRKCNIWIYCIYYVLNDLFTFFLFVCLFVLPKKQLNFPNFSLLLYWLFYLLCLKYVKEKGIFNSLFPLFPLFSFICYVYIYIWYILYI